MMKLLLLAAIVVIVYVLVRQLFAKRSATEDDRRAAPEPSKANLVRCVECGAFVPKTDAVATGGGFRCAAGCAPR